MLYALLTFLRFPPTQWVPTARFPEVKRPKHKADYKLPSSTEGTNERK